MGLERESIRFLAYCRNSGVDFSETLMIGRQKFLVARGEMRQALSQVLGDDNLPNREWFAAIEKGYAEPLFSLLGAKLVVALDYSNYEGATEIHDMNGPIPERLKGQFSVVLDGGTLEHVFNFPVALKNCMEMVKEGGHFLLMTPTNNFVGHGFYQFSPELFYNAFSAVNGFEVRDMFAFETGHCNTWRRVPSPEIFQRRVGFLTRAPAYLFVVARRTSKSPIFETLPQQSDYREVWNGNQAVVECRSARESTVSRFVRSLIPVCLKRWRQERFAARNYDSELFPIFDPRMHGRSLSDEA